jgi:pyruvate dehydrogenase E2 component (dihydrolipoamide acetyltransferase)
MSMEIVRVPDIGSDDAVDVIEVSVKAGDQLAEETTIVVLESDKATVEVPSPKAGTVKKVLVKTGDRVKQGDPLLELEAGAEAAASTEKASAEKPAEDKPVTSKPAEPERTTDIPESSETAAAEPVAATQTPAKPAPAAAPSAPPAQAEASAAAAHAGPAVRKLCREMGVDVAAVTGTGPRGRVLQEDVHSWVKQRLAEPAAGSGGMSGLPVLPEIDFSRFGPVERVELNKLRKVSAANLHRSWVTIPHVTQHDLADITELEAFRQSENARLGKEGVKLTMLAFLVRACAVALAKFPRFNSSMTVDGEALIEKRYIHIGVAVETENGLMVPVLRDADKKGIVQIAAEVGELAAKARNRKLTPADMQGGTFSISSLGGIGGTAFTPIVNWPEVAILGVSKSEMTPRWNGKAFEPRLMLPLSLSYDHRVIDGADAARFITYLNQLLTDMRRALL